MPEVQYHDLLNRQLAEAKIEVSALPSSIAKLLAAVDQTYAQLESAQRDSQNTVKLRTDQLIASVSQAYSFLDGFHMGLVMCDVNPEVVLANAAIQGMLNGKTGHRTSWTLTEIDAVLGPAWSLRQRVKDCLKQGRTMEFKQVQCGELVLRISMAPMINQAGGTAQQIGAIVLAEDITDQVVMARSKDEFFFIASHELRTPLTAIRGNSSLIIDKKDKLSEEMMSEMMHDIHDSAVRLIEIVNDFLDVSALEQGKIEMRPANFRLDLVAGEVLRDLGNVASTRSDKLVVDQSLTRLPAVYADQQRIKQVIYNLVGNAIKFTVNGQVVVGGESDGRMVRCWIKDSGAGMSDDSHRLLFRKFQQASGTNLLNRDSTKGTGLGLYISKLIVELSGGQISLEQSEPGQGSTFSFSIPAAIQ